MDDYLAQCFVQVTTPIVKCEKPFKSITLQHLKANDYFPAQSRITAVLEAESVYDAIALMKNTFADTSFPRTSKLTVQRLAPGCTVGVEGESVMITSSPAPSEAFHSAIAPSERRL